MQKGQQKGGWAYPSFPFGFPISAVTATKTLSPGECGIVVVRSAAACTLTLPDPVGRSGLWYLIVNAADQDLILAAGTIDTLITFNDLAADSIDLDQAGNKIGGLILAVCDGTNWIAGTLTAHTQGVNT
jgi:hypothetical protein